MVTHITLRCFNASNPSIQKDLFNTRMLLLNKTFNFIPIDLLVILEHTVSLKNKDVYENANNYQSREVSIQENRLTHLLDFIRCVLFQDSDSHSAIGKTIIYFHNSS
jgi:hypothetical protein